MQPDLRDVYFLPLDMPNLELPEFSAVFAERSSVMPETSTAVISNGVEGKTSTSINYWDQWVAFSGGKWHDSFSSVYPGAVSVFEGLPYERLIRVYFFKQVRTVDPHTDFVTGLYTSFPSAMRYWAINDELDSTFYFERDGEKVFPNYPEETRWWAMNSTSMRHGSDMPLSGEKIILGIYGIPDETKFGDLLQRSSQKYQGFVLRR